LLPRPLRVQVDTLDGERIEADVDGLGEDAVHAVCGIGQHRYPGGAVHPGGAIYPGSEDEPDPRWLPGRAMQYVPAVRETLGGPGTAPAHQGRAVCVLRPALLQRGHGVGEQRAVDPRAVEPRAVGPPEVLRK